MRNVLLWGTALLFLATALYTVAVRRAVYSLARENGALAHRLEEDERTCANLDLDRERLRSPVAVRERAARAGILAETVRR